MQDLHTFTASDIVCGPARLPMHLLGTWEVQIMIKDCEIPYKSKACIL